MDSIMQNVKVCIVCGACRNIHEHHIYFGANRKVSEQNGFKCYLCGHHHNQSNEGVHGKNGHELDLHLKQECQRVYERNHTRKEFIGLIGRSYL